MPSTDAADRRPGIRVGILALQGDVREHLAVLDDLGAAGVQVRRPMDLEGVQALVVPGGESTTMSILLQSSGLLPGLEKLLADGVPVLGTCAGMILLSREILDGRSDQISLGAIDLVVRRNAFGRQLESFETDLAVDGLEGGPMHALFIRAPIVETAGPDVEVLATVRLDRRGEDSTARAVVCRQGPVIVAAFHPELSGDGRLHQMMLDQIEVEGD
ncbi:MAG: pyridoxal 5'-phosphate synthase glutaminase subunit PdxT [Acidimicrobiales bacterium]